MIFEGVIAPCNGPYKPFSVQQKLTKLQKIIKRFPSKITFLILLMMNISKLTFLLKKQPVFDQMNNIFPLDASPKNCFSIFVGFKATKLFFYKLLLNSQPIKNSEPFQIQFAFWVLELLLPARVDMLSLKTVIFV